jgi:adenine-specific DNA glycosylase
MQLPDAERRLQICERSFKKSYGENLSRVAELKGSAENEKTQIMKLHLLQGVLYFHQNRRAEANAMLSVAERELNELRVDENSILMLMEMGYTRSEAVTGLRSSYNSIDGAVNVITERRVQLTEARKKGKKERNLKKCLENLGMQEVNLKTLGSLIDMGFQKEIAALALKKCQNEIATAVSFVAISWFFSIIIEFPTDFNAAPETC